LRCVELRCVRGLEIVPLCSGLVRLSDDVEAEPFDLIAAR